MRKLRVVLVDDHAVLQEGLAILINTQSDMEVVACAEDGRTALLCVQEYHPDVVVVDISMPGVNGVQATTQIRQLYPEVHVVVLTRHSEPCYIRQLLQSGARGYVLKQAVAKELITAIRAVASGETYLDTMLAHRVARQFVAAGTNPGQRLDLSDRETSVVRLIAYGYSNKEIASQLGISVKTVDTYKLRAMEKLGLHSRAALVRYALQRGWFDDQPG